MTTLEAPRRPTGPTRTFVGPLDRAKLIAAGEVAVVCGRQRFTHAELCERVSLDVEPCRPQAQLLLGAAGASARPDLPRAATDRRGAARDGRRRRSLAVARRDQAMLR
jgi:hypothetical protein